MIEVLEVLLIYGCILAISGFILLRFAEFAPPREQKKFGSSVIWGIIFLLSVLIIGVEQFCSHMNEAP